MDDWGYEPDPEQLRLLRSQLAIRGEREE